ncbi:MAG: ubiquinol-cytochrome c reductase iron-sulfur subunit [Hyphomicrobiales bacterium]
MAETVDEGRRDFLYLATGAVAAVGVAGVAWPLIDQMNPDASVQALSSIEADLSAIEEGQAVTLKWRGKPVFVRYRTQKNIDEARAVAMEDLPDQFARNNNSDASTSAADENRVVKGRENWLIMVGICTHLGCIPKGQGINDERGDYDGWFCPCHGSHYDSAGRIRKGPAPENLLIPVYTFLSDTTIQIG